MSRLKSIAKGLKDGAKNKVNKVVDSDSKVVRNVRNIPADAKRLYGESGAKEILDTGQSQLSTKLDEFSGQAMYQLVQERLAEQDRFNDLLAVKLLEALERISELEKLVADK